MKKRGLVLLLVMVYAAASFMLPAPAAAALEEDTEIRLLNDLIGFLYKEEILYEDMLKAVDAIGAFDRERNWSSLLMARATLAVVRKDVASLTVPEVSMTAEDQMVLLDSGIDASFMERAAISFQAEQTAMLNELSSLRNSLVLDVYLQDDWETAMTYTRLQREIAETQLQYNANMAVWILTKIDHPEAAEQFSQLLADYCPLIYACQASSPVSAEENEAASEALLGKREEQNQEMNIITGAKGDRINRLAEQIETGDWESIGRNLLPISDMPAILIIPPRFEAAEEMYYWTENGEILPTPRPETMPDRLPDCCQVRIGNVSREEADAYQQTMNDAGASPVSEKEEDGVLTLLYMYDGASFSVEWKDDTMTILMVEKPLCFIPMWYLPARSAAAD